LQQSQVDLFTAAIWYAGKLHPTVIVINKTKRAKDTVVVYISCRLFRPMHQSHLKLYIWSDVPVFQFKNRYIATAIVVLNGISLPHLMWKEPVDGIGASARLSAMSGLLLNHASM